MTASIDWTAFVPAAVALSLIPGPNQLLSVRNAIRYGTAPATIALGARFAVFASMTVAVAIGLGALLTRSALVFDLVKWVGVAYLLYFGLSTLWRARRSPVTDEPDVPELTALGRVRRAMRGELLVAATNPKAMLLFAAFLPQFLPSGADASGSLLILAAAYIGIEACSAIAYTVLGGVLGRLDLTARAHRNIDRVTGAAFVGLGGYLATAQRP
ncbi:LysE family translocator [Nocardia tenerifensis]|nr:LysE family translocator [Nocardia tenerifensis]